MPVQQTFMGATIRSASSSIGWGSQASQIAVRLVVDPANYDVFAPPSIGSPVFFIFGTMRFSGIFQKYEQQTAIDGKDVFEVIVVDPREILDGAQIITAAYSGSVGAVRNLYNAFGWWENNAGFGQSLSNDSGMPWLRIRDSLLSMINAASSGPYGGPLQLGTYTYGLDLSELPSPPIYYRMNGPNLNLLDAISQICNDGGCDFFVEMVGYTIKIRTVSRLNQPVLGTISAIANANIGTTIRSVSGLELRNEVTSSFLVGGEQTRLHLSNGIYQFFGYDIDGVPIIGFDSTVELFDTGGGSLGSVAVLQMNLNSSEVADIWGAVIYPTTTLELRLAKGNDFGAWASYITHYRPDVAARIGLITLNKNLAAPGVALGKPDLVDDSTQNAQLLAAATSSDAAVRSMRFYDFVRRYADEYYGRKYLVAIPFITNYTDPESLKLINSYDISGEGAYLPEGSVPLGLSELNEDIFKNQDGRFRSFVEYTSLLSADLSSISPQGTVVENGSLFVEVQVDPNIIYYQGYPFALVTLPSALYEKALDSKGNHELVLKATLQMAPGPDAQRILKNTYADVRICPEVLVPQFAAIPLRSNIFTYGPWYLSGVAGKVNFEYDPSMTPWSCGDYNTMNLAGYSRVNSAVTNMLISETGTAERAGAPEFNLGDIMQSGGPNLTSIDVQSSTSGITTTYRWATFTSKFGVFSKGNIERMKKMSLTALSLRRSVRAALRNQLVKQGIVSAAGAANNAFFAKAPKALKQETPNDVFVSHSYYDSAADTVRMTMQTATFEEAVTLSNADDSVEFKQTAIMSLNGLFRPFTVDTNSTSKLPKFSEPVIVRGCPCKTTLNPFADSNDIDVYTWGDSYAGLNAFRRGGDFDSARGIAIKGPMILAGFGYGINTKVVPKHADNDGFADNYLTRQDTWKCGPVDMLWDDKRGVWTCHDILKGKTGSKFPADGSGLFTVKSRNALSDDWQMTAWNYFSTEISGDLKAMIGYVANDNRWYIMSADCPSG